jgi:hypothetical protein
VWIAEEEEEEAEQALPSCEAKQGCHDGSVHGTVWEAHSLHTKLPLSTVNLHLEISYLVKS